MFSDVLYVCQLNLYDANSAENSKLATKVRLYETSRLISTSDIP